MLIFLIVITGCSSTSKFTDKESSHSKSEIQEERIRFGNHNSTPDDNENSRERNNPKENGITENETFEIFRNENEPKGNEIDQISEDSLANYEDEYKDYPVLERKTGITSFYAKKFHGRKTSSGEIFDQEKLTAAHVSYPFNTIIRVINTKNNKSVVVKVNDRRPHHNGRIIDLSRKAAEEIGMIKSGLAKVKIEVLQWGEKKSTK